MQRSADPTTNKRLRGELEELTMALKGLDATLVDDPLGEDGQIEVRSKTFQANGRCDLTMVKGQVGEDQRFTRFRSWGAGGTEFVEKSSYLVKANGYHEFHKKTAEPEDMVSYTQDLGEEDRGWLASVGAEVTVA